MKILKPPWIGNDDKPLFSVDIHPDGSRFATAGQGESSGRITIWNMEPLSYPEKEKDNKTAKMLCRMDNHFACVNCVRWSNNGTLLASAGDDKLVMIWRYAGGVSKTFGSDQDNMETWRCVHTLRGHSGDVLDVSWSPHDQYLASCSIDNTIVIWNAQKFPDQIKVLTGHTSLVKGITWDPVGKYLASQSDDKSLIIWRTMDWKEEKTITNPFSESGGTTHVLRLGWSPDGSYLVSAHAMNNMGPTAQIISRSGWATDMDFVGHRKAVTCVRFNPRLLCRKVKKSNKEKTVNYCCCAVGSRDSSLSLWLTALRRPLVVLHDLFSNSILDMSWNRGGNKLIACSSDGTVAYIELSSAEVGTSLSTQEQERLMCKVYGKSTLVNGASRAPIIENAALLTLTNTQFSYGMVSPPISNRTSTPQNQPTPAKSLTNGITTQSKQRNLQTPSKQIETITKDGRRRITPIFLSPPPDVADLVPPQPVFSSTNQTSRIVIEHASSNDHSRSLHPTYNDDEKEKERPTSQGEIDDMITINPMSMTEARKLTPKKNKEGKESIEIPSSSPKPSTSKEPEAEVINKIAVKRKGQPAQASGKKRKEDTKTRDKTPQPEAVTELQTTAVERRHPQRDKIVSVKPSLKLPIPNINKQILHQMHGSSTDELSVYNNITIGHNKTISRVQYLKNEDSVWELIMNNPVTHIESSSSLICISCKNRQLSVLSPHGLRILPDIILDSEISYLSVEGPVCMTVTTDGYMNLWDFGTGRSLIKNESLSGLITKSTEIRTCKLSETGLPIVYMNCGTEYFYHTPLQTWMLLNSAQDVISNLSDQTVQNRIINSNIISPTSQPQISRQPINGLRMLHKVDGSIQRKCTLTVINQQMVLCKTMNNQSEYRDWLLLYVRTLTQHDDERGLRVIFKQCTQSVYKSKRSITHPSVTSTSSSHNDIPHIDLMNLDRKELLKDILSIIATNLNLQRLYVEYKDIVEHMIT